MTEQRPNTTTVTPPRTLFESRASRAATKGELMSSTTSTDKALTVSAAAAHLNVTPRTVRRWIKQGRLRAYRVGPRCIRIDRDDLAALAHPIGEPIRKAHS
jgi:excisionase family DNA binding protein